MSTSTPEVDDDSVDLTLSSKIHNGNHSRPKLDVQLKATCAVREVHAQPSFQFALKIKNYDDLRRVDLHVPRILVVLRLPPDIGTWLAQDHHSLSLKRCAYWTSLRGLSASTNTTKVAIKIETAKQFTVAALNAMLNGIANGTNP